jgi:ATP-dependent protease ClpP protease subunit
MLAFAGAATAKTLEIDATRVIEVNGVVNDTILKSANKLIKLADVSLDPVTIVINSPGGYVSSGMQFVTAMRLLQRRGVLLRCVVPTAAASMAFIIFNECDERYAFQTSSLLWHGVRVSISGTFTIRDLKVMTRSMQRIAAGLDHNLLANLKIRTGLFYYYYHNNSWIPAKHLNQITKGNYLTLIDDVTGYDKLLFINFRTGRGWGFLDTIPNSVRPIL